jgi:hypothetical protein
MHMTKAKITSRIFTFLIIILILGFGDTPLQAGDFHASPRDYLFGNNFDSHQETKLKLDKNGNPASLSGFFYIKFTGEMFDGLPVAEHPSGNDCVDGLVECVVGWTLQAVPTEATFVFHEGIKDDHPVWLVDRTQIPQPGSFTHFHWIGSDSTDPRILEVPPACDVNGASALEPAAVGVTCPGWFVEIRAVRKFAFDHGDETVPVRPGLDNATHLNLLTNIP